MENNATSEDYLRDEAQNDLPKIGSGSYVNKNNGEHVQYELATGCWIDGHWGVYGITRLIEIAQDLGFEISDDDEHAVYAYKDYKQTFIGVDGETYDTDTWVVDTADDAEEWLNDNVAQPGYSFGWSDGEFFLMEDIWWSEDEDFVLDPEFQPYFSNEPLPESVQKLLERDKDV